MNNRLYKSKENKMLFGVCGGISEIYALDVSIVRLIAFLLVFFTGIGFILYIALAIILPYKPVEIEYEKKAD